MTAGAPEASGLVLALSTAPDAETAARIARALVQERLVACANLVPGLTSVYRWEGAVEEAAEVLLLMKTRRELVGPLKERIAALHPYQVPELVSAPIEDGLPAYLDWVRAETEDAGPREPNLSTGPG
ncbi:MAG TPA: divalent-cation tolerance protein CutA [Longimicrobium sp.]|nr:divalent-cation tolerance protein CutA [Longimicrobium sp.]